MDPWLVLANTEALFTRKTGVDLAENSRPHVTSSSESRGRLLDYTGAHNNEATTRRAAQGALQSAEYSRHGRAVPSLIICFMDSDDKH